jgi:hypothetical protein
LSAREPAATGAIDLPVVATDACDRTYAVDTVSVTLAETTPIVVSALDLSVVYPPGQSYLPTTAAVPATIQVRANPEAAGAHVSLEASSGAFDSSGDGSTDLVLAPAGEDAAGVDALLYADAAGTITLTARSDAQVDTALAEAAGPPRLTPSTAELPPGASIAVRIDTAGALASATPCAVTPTSAFSVESGGEDVAAGASPVDTDSDGAPDLEVSVAADVTEAADVTVTCRDRYGQVGTGSYHAIIP